MNSIEAAKKKIEENNESIKLLRSEAKYIRERIADYKTKIEVLEQSISAEEDKLRESTDERFALLVDNLALKTFVADGGGLDMFD